MNPLFKYIAQFACWIMLLGASPIWAQSMTQSAGQLSDAAFYRAVTCLAPPGENCKERSLRWPKFIRGRLSVSLAGVQGSNPYFVSRVRNALEGAIVEINNAGSGIRLRSVWGPQANLANIQIYVVAPPAESPKIQKLSFPPLIGRVADPSVTVRSTLGSRILSAGIGIAMEPKIEGQLRGIVLREILAGLGFKYKVQNSFYVSRSVLAMPYTGQIGRLGPADVKALRLHYPR